MDDKTCLICYEEGDLFTIKCGHKFHYDCIMKEYKYQKRCICPYCRTNNKFLKLKDNYIPQLGIHKEYFDFFLEPKYCCSIIKSGKNKGKKCVNKVTKSGSCTIIDGVKKYYCGRHKIKKNINLKK